MNSRSFFRSVPRSDGSWQRDLARKQDTTSEDVAGAGSSHVNARSTAATGYTVRRLAGILELVSERAAQVVHSESPAAMLKFVNEVCLVINFLGIHLLISCTVHHARY